MSTYQAASGAGKEGMDELFNGAKEVRVSPSSLLLSSLELSDTKVYAPYLTHTEGMDGLFDGAEEVCFKRAQPWMAFKLFGGVPDSPNSKRG